MNKRPKKLELYDEIALLLATTLEEATAMRCWRCLRKMVRPDTDLFVVNPKTIVSRFVINEQIDRMIDAGVPYSAIAQQLHLDWRSVRHRRDEWHKLSETAREERRDRWRSRDPDTTKELIRSEMVKRQLREWRKEGEDDAG